MTERDRGTEGQSDEGTKGRKGTKGQKGQRDRGFTNASGCVRLCLALGER